MSDERLKRIEALAQNILKASKLLDAEDWQSLERVLGDSARQSRVLFLMEHNDKEGAD